jgi:SAM-dependent methyltransferase
VPAKGALSVLDLGCGTGANLRHSVPLLAAAGHRHQRWTCLDHDRLLLDRLYPGVSRWAEARGMRVSTFDGELRLESDQLLVEMAAHSADLLLDLNELQLPTEGLVTASALLDLVSLDWLENLLDRCRTSASALLFALTYNGRCELSPGHPSDAKAVALVNLHQRTDKGFGPALGPDAARALVDRCAALDYRVHTADTPWQIPPDAVELQRALLQGWHEAARQLAETEDARGELDAWVAERLAAVAAGRSRLRVGHLDVLALPGRGVT